MFRPTGVAVGGGGSGKTGDGGTGSESFRARQGTDASSTSTSSVTEIAMLLMSGRRDLPQEEPQEECRACRTKGRRISLGLAASRTASTDGRALSAGVGRVTTYTTMALIVRSIPQLPRHTQPSSRPFKLTMIRPLQLKAKAGQRTDPTPWSRGENLQGSQKGD